MALGILNQVSYSGKNLPTVIFLGDTLIDSDYSIGHGALDGFKRIDLLLEHIEIINHCIVYFDSEQYSALLSESIQDHIKALIDRSAELRERFSNWLPKALSRIEQAKDQADIDKQAIYQEMLNELPARISYSNLSRKWEQLQNTNDYSTLLPEMHKELMQALSLPERFVAERIKVYELLPQLALLWKNLGKELFTTKKQYSESIDAYRRALEIYEISGERGVEYITVHSNLLIVYKEAGWHAEAMHYGVLALRCITDAVYNSVGNLQEKILFNLIKTIHSYREIVPSNNFDQINSLSSDIAFLMDAYKSVLSEKNYQTLAQLINQTHCDPVASIEIGKNNQHDSDSDVVKNCITIRGHSFKFFSCGPATKKSRSEELIANIGINP